MTFLLVILNNFASKNFIKKLTMRGLEGLKQEQVRALIGKFYIENWMNGKMIHIRSFSGYFDVYLNLTFSGTSPLDDPIF